MGLKLSKSSKKRPKSVTQRPKTPQENENPKIIEGKLYKLVVLGEGGVGKTAFSVRLFWDKFVHEYDPTIEDAYKKEYKIDGKDIEIEIIDTAGQEEYSSALQDKFIRSGEGFLCVYSITSMQTFLKVKELRERILWTLDHDNVPMVLIGNKCDLEHQREVSREAAEALAKEFKCPFFETSAKTAANVADAVEMLIWEIAKKGGANS
eukprot:TRINITY_DN86_c0_g1_i1.p1 TRINITY_DN86_c0_g1~~TRINITY_DN86_c0_g1_i1.p1  ORF type:complete len:207 (-),score=48.37 TRINITY_DN86_c0_g1_i1:256-876(-)